LLYLIDIGLKEIGLKVLEMLTNFNKNRLVELDVDALFDIFPAAIAEYVGLCEQTPKIYRMLNIPNAILPILVALYY